MHARLIVLLDRDGEESSTDARQRAEMQLLDEGFAGEGGLFACQPADYFAIGGRWTGDLTLARLDQGELTAFQETFHERQATWRDRRVSLEEQREEAWDLFRQFFPEHEGEPPIWRETRKPFGHEDDAQVLDDTLFEYLRQLRQYPGEASRDDLYRGNCFVDLDEPESVLKPEAIGKKWCVVVDFHY